MAKIGYYGTPNDPDLNDDSLVTPSLLNMTSYDGGESNDDDEQGDTIKDESYLISDKYMVKKVLNSKTNLTYIVCKMFFF